MMIRGITSEILYLYKGSFNTFLYTKKKKTWRV